ncbi:MAG: hypothetical protein MPJ50_16585 [Pirellulales bacterium]|nr:hypothetical protein [Pirellulales bacterium]
MNVLTYKLLSSALFCVFFGSAVHIPADVFAERPRVGFDVGYLIPCREITPPEFAAANPNEMLVEAVFDISSLIQAGEESDLVQVFYRLHGCGALSVVDHLPRTEFATDVAGPIQVERKGEKSAKLGGNAAGEYPGVVNAKLNLSAGTSNATTVRYELLPPQELVAASGTVNRGRGVYFKLKPSARESLEGARQFVCVFRAPRSWRADVVTVSCSAVYSASLLSPTFEETIDCGRAEFQVGLYLEGDEPARGVMTEFLNARERLLTAVTANRERLEARLFANHVPGWGKLRALVESRNVAEIAHEVEQRHIARTLDALDVPAKFDLIVGDYCSAKIRLEEIKQASPRPLASKSQPAEDGR